MESSGPLSPPCLASAGRAAGARAGSGLTMAALLVAGSVVLVVIAFALDERVATTLELKAGSPWADCADWCSTAGEGWVIAAAGALAAGWLAWTGRSKLARVALAVMAASLLAGATATVLRTLISRTRPHARAEQGFYWMRYRGAWVAGRYEFGSFPSGHTATVVGLVAALWIVNRRAGLSAVPYAGLVAWSRIAQANHHFSDVVAASLLALWSAPGFLSLSMRLTSAGKAGAAPSPPAGHAVGGAGDHHSQDRSSNDPCADGGVAALPHLSVVVPSFNEEGNLEPLIGAIQKALGPLSVSWEVVVADDCSTDGSWGVLRRLGAADPRIRGVRLARNSGQSAALWAGVQSARGAVIATMDADLQNVPDDLPGMLAALKGCDCVCGTRIATRKHGDSIVRRLSSRIANGVRNWITRESVTDSGCGYRVFRRECAANLKYFRGMHRFLPTLFRIEGWRVAEVPITHRPRLSGRTHYGVWDRLLTSSYDLMAVRWMQRRMFPFRIQESSNLPSPPRTTPS